MNPSLASAVSLVICLILPASAAMVYNEASQGDLPQGASAPVLPASTGTNIVSGIVSYTTILLDIDYFSFVVPPGSTASNLTYSFSNTSLTGNEQVSGNVWFYAGTIPSGLTYLTNTSWIARAPGSIYGSSSASPVVLNTGSLSPGNYTVAVAPNGRSINGGSVPYSASFDLAPIPEPTTAILTLLSAATLPRRRWKTGSPP